MTFIKNLYKSSLIGLFAVSSTANAFVMESGKYVKGDLDLNDPVVEYKFEENGKPADWQYNPSPSVTIKFLDSNTVVISNAGSKQNFPQPIAINLGQNGESDINETAFRALKQKYADSKFANMVQNISTEVTSRSNDHLKFTVNFDLNLNSKFGIVENIRLSTDFSLENFKCERETTNRIDSSKRDKDGLMRFDSDYKRRRTKIDCVKLVTFKNTRLTDFKTSLDDKLNKAVALAADVAIQLITSAMQVNEYLLKK